MRLKKSVLDAMLLAKYMTQKKLAYEAGVTEATISHIANGRNCSLETAAKIAKALECRLDDLIEKE